MPPATKTLSPAELAKLEHAFATDPVSEAYKPLAEAYLGMGRFMEAMVVCKKGVKAHPARPDPRVLLARVYAEQGKDKKAIEELQGALQVAPTNKIALRLMGSLQVKSGENDAGKANLLKAFESDPGDGETAELMQKHGVSVPRPVVVVAPPPPAPPPVLHPSPSAPAEPIDIEADVEAPAPVPAAAPPPSRPQAQAQPRRVVSSGGRAAVARAPARPKPPPQEYDEDHDSISDPSGVRPPPARSGSSKALFFLLIFAVPVGAAAYYGLGQYKAKQVKDANALLRQATEKLKTDTFAAYQESISLAENALAIDASSDTNRAARGLLAYAYTVRWGEHQHDETIREGAERNLKAGLEAKEASSQLHAADALFDYYNGKGTIALKKIDERIKVVEGEKKQVSLYYLTRGLIQMNTGDLEDAKESLEKAQSISPDDARIFVALGTLHRRRGADVQALSAYNNALTYNRTHPDALLGTANLILDQEDPAKGYVTATKYVKAMLEMQPPPSPRQLAQAHFVRALLISRLTLDLPLYPAETRKQLEEGTGITSDEAKNGKEVQKEEADGLALDRNNPELMLVRAHRLVWEKKLDEAAAELRRAIDASPTAAHYHVELAKVLMRKPGGEPQAEEALKKALSMVQNSPKLLSLLGQVQYREKNYADAMATLERATGDEKIKNPEAKFVLGKIYRDGDKKDLDKATKLLERAAVEYFADATQAAASWDELAVTYEQRNKDGDKDKARSAYERALNADKEYSPAYCHYVKFLLKLGDARERDKLKALATEGLKLDPQGSCAGDFNRAKEG